MLQKGGQLEAFMPEAERQLSILKQSMPRGRVAKSFPKEERELNDLYARTQKGLQSIDKEVVQQDASQANPPVKQAKRARMVALAQQASASKADLAALVNKAGSTMYMLEHQLPAADRKMFPKEARELQSAFSKDLNQLSKIRAELQPKSKGAAVKAQRMSLAAKSGAMPEMRVGNTKQLDADMAKDEAENHRKASSSDLDSFFGAVNGPAQPASKKSKQTSKKAVHLSMLAKAEAEDSSDQSVTNKRGDVQLPTAKKVAQKLGVLGHKGKGKGNKVKRAPSLTGPSSSIQSYGTVFDPTLSWGRMPQQDLVGGGKKYFDHYAQEASAYNNVFDPVTNNHAPDINRWEVNGPHGKSKWWVHDHFGRGY